MKFCLITFRSVMPAQQGERLLRRAGFICSLQRTPRWMQEQGCGYSLRVRSEDVGKCIEALQKGEIPFRKVYMRTENGRVEELSL